MSNKLQRWKTVSLKEYLRPLVYDGPIFFLIHLHNKWAVTKEIGDTFYITHVFSLAFLMLIISLTFYRKDIKGKDWVFIVLFFIFYLYMAGLALHNVVRIICNVLIVYTLGVSLLMLAFDYHIANFQKLRKNTSFYDNHMFMCLRATYIIFMILFFWVILRT